MLEARTCYRVEFEQHGEWLHTRTPDDWPDIEGARLYLARTRKAWPKLRLRIVRIEVSVVETDEPGVTP